MSEEVRWGEGKILKKYDVVKLNGIVTIIAAIVERLTNRNYFLLLVQHNNLTEESVLFEGRDKITDYSITPLLLGNTDKGIVDKLLLDWMKAKEPLKLQNNQNSTSERKIRSLRRKNDQVKEKKNRCAPLVKEKRKNKVKEYENEEEEEEETEKKKRRTSKVNVKGEENSIEKEK